MKKYHVVIDTNVLVSALLSHSIESPVRRIWSYINEGIIIPVYNGDIISEYGDVLSRDKFGFDISDINNVLRLITAIRPYRTGMPRSRRKDLRSGMRIWP